MSKPKIGILINSFSQGGAERVVSTFLPSLVSDYDVTLFLGYNVIKYPIPKEVEIEILTNGSIKHNTFEKVLDFFKIRRKYLQLLRDKKIEVTISFLALSNIINGIANKKNPTLKTIISERCYPSLMYRSSKMSWLIANNILPKFYNANDLLFSNSIEINKDLKTNFGVDIPMHVIYNPIEQSTGIKEYTEKSTKFELVNVGSMYGPKNQELILKALNNLNNKDYQLTIYGDGPDQVKLQDYSAQKELEDQVLFAGRVNNIKTLLLKHDSFILSSNTEGFPNVLLEAMSMGLACISTNCLSGPLELLNNNEPIVIEKGDFAFAKFGLMIQVGDEIGLAKAIDYLHKNPSKLTEYGALAYQRSKDFEVSKIYQQLKNLIDN